jgi:hypothetical protein
MTTWDDQITLILSRAEAIGLSAVILSCGPSHKRSHQIESIRKKLRAQLDHRRRDDEEEESQLAMLAATYRQQND